MNILENGTYGHFQSFGGIIIVETLITNAMQNKISKQEGTEGICKHIRLSCCSAGS